MTYAQPAEKNRNDVLSRNVNRQRRIFAALPALCCLTLCV